jgi:predicted nucleotidyltransferase
VLSDGRRSEFGEVKNAIRAWASACDEIDAVLLVGSWARDAARMDSDVDVVVVTESQHFVDSESWIPGAVGGDAVLVRTGDWGALVERRVRLRSGLDVEFGFVKPSWTSIDPIDPGTLRVVTDGCEIWYDPKHHLSNLSAAAV